MIQAVSGWSSLRSNGGRSSCWSPNAGPSIVVSNVPWWNSLKKDTWNTCCLLQLWSNLSFYAMHPYLAPMQKGLIKFRLSSVEVPGQSILTMRTKTQSPTMYYTSQRPQSYRAFVWALALWKFSLTCWIGDPFCPKKRLPASFKIKFLSRRKIWGATGLYPYFKKNGLYPILWLR